MRKPLILIILDGYGIGPKHDNAIAAAKKPNLDKLFNNNPVTQILASGMAVGLPDGQMGNSEVGHTNIGAGRVVYQDLTRISKAIEDKIFFENKELLGAIENAKKKRTKLHLIGLLSDGGVHSHNSHLYALLKLAKKSELENVYVHAFLDGRDTLPTSGKGFILDCEEKMREIGVGKIATVSGRYYAMDRDNRWDRVEKVYSNMVYGEGIFCGDPKEVIERSYETGITDEFVVPTVCDKSGLICENDSVIFFNFRPDRAREITRAFVDDNFDKFKREKGFFKTFFVCMTQYEITMPNSYVAFSPQSLKNTFSEYISKLGMTQLKIAETEKYAHVTFFFNGGIEKAYPGEDRVLIPSPKVATYDLKPEMSAFKIAKTAVEKVRSGKYDVVVINFANCDMVGHTGVFEATVKAVQAVDTCVGEVVKAVCDMSGYLIVTADHGNAEKMRDETGKVFTAHTTNPVPFCVVCYPCKFKKSGRLSDIAPTMLDILNIEKPKEMTGKSLIEHD
ncbi:MAG: 2,3-bisphosphoglycerate-independent phosphoglycerate mutase [Eubacteriales bacterium SKADARSKE-1]|nr:2,3-bisphosphoglycerate-independent phosphoglycerate mutase [Eubacteriales bacterium SKADARSKE-1]